jgi:erythromycin esterase-like protein
MFRKIILAFLFAVGIGAGIVAGAISFFLASLLTGNIVVDLAAAFVVMGAIVSQWSAVVARPENPKGATRLAAAVSILSVCGVGALLAFPNLRERWSPLPPEADGATMQALAEQTIPLAAVQPRSGFEDLQALKPILEGKRIVALGEATHGTREFFQMKHRMLEFLVTEMGFTHFGMETGSETAVVIDDYIHGGTGDPRTVLYWPWATEEVMEMLDWMRAYNADPRNTRKLTFHGIDPIAGERDRIMGENVAGILAENGPQSKIVLWAHNYHVSMQEGRLGFFLKRDFGEQAYIIGFEFNQGEFTSRMVAVHTYREGPASTAYYAHALARLEQPVLFLDFQTMSRDPILREWLEKDQSSHELQELHAIFRLVPDWHTLHISWLRMYDGLIFIEKSTPAVGLS